LSLLNAANGCDQMDKYPIEITREKVAGLVAIEIDQSERSNFLDSVNQARNP